MALTLGINSFATVQEFDEFTGDRLDMTAAFTAETSAKSAALISATDILNELSWTGVVVDRYQPLAFPRNGGYFDPRVGGWIGLSDVPRRIKQATFELAYHLLTNESLQDSTGSVKNIQVGSISLQDIKSAPRIPLKVTNIIRPILVNQGANGWWRAN